jgi:trimeric autotransporter adhesin
MNTIYRIVWNAATGKWVVASELAKGRKKKAARVAGFATALALGLSFGGNVAMADTAAPGSSCTMPSGVAGALDESGFCMTNAGGSMNLSSVGTMATVDDAMFKVNGASTSSSSGTNTIAIGSGAQSNAAGSAVGNIAIGSNAKNQNTGAGAMVMGRSATIQGTGGNAAVTAASSIAIGDSANIYGSSALAFGAKANSTHTGNMAIGASASSTGGSVSLALGTSSSVSASGSVALGQGSSTNRATAVAIGSTTATRQLVNVGAGTQATDAVIVDQLMPTATALGASFNTSTGAVTLPAYSVGGTTVTNVGDAVTNVDGRVNANTTDITRLSTQIGAGTAGLVQQDAVTNGITVAAGMNGGVIGVAGSAGARKVTGVAGGDESAASAEAVNGSQVNATNQQVLQNTGELTVLNTSVTNIDHRVTAGTTTIADLQSQLANGTIGLVQQNALGDITVAAQGNGQRLDVSGSGGERRVTGVASGTQDTDAVVFGQLKAAGVVDPSGRALLPLTYDDLSLAAARLGGMNGTMIDNVAAGRIAAGSMQAINGGQLYNLQQNFQGQFDALNGQVTQLNDRVGVIEQGMADGSVGLPGEGGGNGSGYVPSPGTGDNSLVVGEGADASGNNSAAVGNGAIASGDHGSAIGNGAVASGNNGTAVGAGASATADNAVALGAGSVADRANSVSVGSAGNERQITNVAAGTAPTDAVNVQQLTDTRNWAQSYTDGRMNAIDSKIGMVGRRANAGTAAAIAMANMPQGYAPGQKALSVGVGTFAGENALAAGLTTISPNGRWVFRASLSANSQGDAGVGFSAGMAW